MSMGSYDDAEHERREQMAATVDADFEQGRNEFRGSVTYDTGESAEDLLAQFEEIRDA